MSTGGQDGANPFQSPMSVATTYSGGVDPSERTVEMLRQTRPWVFFLAILGTIATCFLVAAFLIQFIVTAGGGRAFAVGGAIGVVSVVLLIYVLPLIFMYRFASRIKRFVLSRELADLDSALEAQKSFWKTVGIIAAIVVIFYIVVGAFAFVGVLAG